MIFADFYSSVQCLHDINLVCTWSSHPWRWLRVNQSQEVCGVFLRHSTRYGCMYWQFGWDYVAIWCFCMYEKQLVVKRAVGAKVLWLGWNIFYTMFICLWDCQWWTLSHWSFFFRHCLVLLGHSLRDCFKFVMVVAWAKLILRAQYQEGRITCIFSPNFCSSSQTWNIDAVLFLQWYRDDEAF